MAPPFGSLFAQAFATDADTERALRAGLTGREAKVQRGRLKDALRTLTAEPSAHLVFVDLDGVKDPAAAVREVAAVCALGTILIAIGSTDTAHVNRALLREGIADYLVKPITATTVRDACSVALDDAAERTYAGRLIAFAGSAGCGAATMVNALARGVVSGGRTALVVDLNPLATTLSSLLGAEPAGDLPALLAEIAPSEPADPDEAEAIEATISPEQLDTVCAPADDGLSLVAFPKRGALPEALSPAVVNTLLEHLANRAHTVFVTGALDPEARSEILNRADARVILYEPTLTSISTAVHCLALLGTEFPAILVQCHPRVRKSTLSPAQIRFALAGRRADIVVPFEPALHSAATGGKRARSVRKAYREAIRQLAERVIEGPAPTPS